MKKQYMQPEYKLTIFAEDAIRTSTFEYNKSMFEGGKFESWEW